MTLKNLNPQTSSVAILGYGKEGTSSFRFLQKLGFENITIHDANTHITIPDTAQAILGDKYMNNLGKYDLIIKSPGISPYQYNLEQYNSIMSSQAQIFFEYYNGKVIGVTGTKGKSTISQLTYNCLKKSGYKTKIVGNIGLPVLDEIDVLSENYYDYIVFELSSYMLEGYRPPIYIGYINNIFPCHLDWHINMGIYTQAKLNIIENANIKIHHASLNLGYSSFGDTTGYHLKQESIYRGNELFLENIETKLSGRHNLENICGVLTILEQIIGDNTILKNILRNTLKDFVSLPHRLENLGIYKGIQFIDDGAAVTPEATIAAIESCGQDIRTLLIGGKDADSDTSILEKKILISNITNIVLFPESGYKLFALYTQDIGEEEKMEKNISGKKITFFKTRSMQEAVKFAYSQTESEKIVLLSSAAQSYSLWKNFEEKGQQYKKYIEKYAGI